MKTIDTARQTGAALSPHLYLDPNVCEREQERIFERTWQLAGHVSQLRQAGSYLTAQAGTQPVLVVRDDAGDVRAYRNVCRHRGSRLLAGEGTCKKAIRCRYHGWTYRLDGTLVGMPEARSFSKVDKGDFGLFGVRAEVLCGLVFVNLDPDATPLAELVGDLPERLAPYGIERLERFDPTTSAQPVNWKIVADNYLEGYHVPIAHPGLMRLLDYQNYEAEVHRDWVWTSSPLREKPSGNRIERLYQRMVTPMPGLGKGDERVWRFVYIWPNTTIDLYPDQVLTWQIVPDGHRATRDVAAGYRPAGASPRTRAVQKLNQQVQKLVTDEDTDLVANVQAGMATRGYACGPLSGREVAVGWFADRVREALGE